MIDLAKLNPVPHIFNGLGYLKARCSEPSTWVGIVGAATAAQELTGVLLWLALIAGIIAVLVKEPKRDGGDAGHS